MEVSDKDGLLALLDFYSSRATAHASLSITVILGIFGLCAIYKPNLKPNMPFEYWCLNFGFFFVSYWILWFVVMYLALNFGWYTQIADKVKFVLLGHQDLLTSFAVYRKCKEERKEYPTVDDFLNDKAQADWLYTTSKSRAYRFVLFIRREFILFKFPPQTRSLTREKWEQLQRIIYDKVEEKGIDKKSLSIHFGLMILPILIFAVKLISDWIG